MSNIKIIDTFDGILNLRDALLEAPNKFYDLYEEYLREYSDTFYESVASNYEDEFDEDSKDSIVKLLTEDFDKLERVHKKFLEKTGGWEERISNVFNIEVDVAIVFSLGYGTDAAEFLRTAGANTVFLSAEKIVEFEMCDDIDVLISHEIAHFVHDKMGGRIFRDEYDDDLKKSSWSLYSEGFASYFGEKLLNGRGQWGYKFDIFCIENYYTLITELREDLNEGRSTSYFFPKWGKDFELYDIGYYIARRYIRYLLKKYTIEEICVFSIEEIVESVDDFLTYELEKRLRHKGSIEIKTDRLVLRRFRVEDANEMFDNWASRDEVTKTLAWRTHESIDETVEFLETVTSNYSNPKYYVWAITLEGEVIGSISCGNIHPINHSAEMGFALSDDYWNEGYTTEALNGVLDFLFGSVNMHRVMAVHLEGNDASAKVMKKAGMQYEGNLREAALSKTGEYTDLHMYSILEEDWNKNKIIENNQEMTTKEEFIKVDSFMIPKADHKKYLLDRQRLERLTREVFDEKYHLVIKDWSDSEDGEALLALNKDGELVDVMHLSPENVNWMLEFDTDESYKEALINR